jgi:hypothetical protein
MKPRRKRSKPIAERVEVIDGREYRVSIYPEVKPNPKRDPTSRYRKRGAHLVLIDPGLKKARLHRRRKKPEQ